ncbi:ATP-dependent metallopeptidase FtsH/Yme1/Tma family protein [Escherichia coli]
MEKKNRWNTGYWIVALLLLLVCRATGRRRKPSSRCALRRLEKALAEGRVAEVLVSMIAGDRAPKVAGQPGQDRQSWQRGSNPILPIACRSTRRALCPRVGEHLAARCAVVILPAVAFFGVWFLLFRRFAEKQGVGRFLNMVRAAPRCSWKRTPV